MLCRWYEFILVGNINAKNQLSRSNFAEIYLTSLKETRYNELLKGGSDPR
jgi:hypothetical protein